MYALALALSLALLPLHALPPHAPGHPVGAEGGMGARVLVMVEGGARLPAPALGLLLMLPPVPVGVRRAGERAPLRLVAPHAAPARQTRLVEFGRLTLEGG